MLSAILKSDIVVDISIKIIDSFVAMRKFLINNAGIFQRIEKIEQKLLKHDDNFNKIFNALESNDTKPTQARLYYVNFYYYTIDLLFSKERTMSLSKKIRESASCVDTT